MILVWIMKNIVMTTINNNDIIWEKLLIFQLFFMPLIKNVDAGKHKDIKIKKWKRKNPLCPASAVEISLYWYVINCSINQNPFLKDSIRYQLVEKIHNKMIKNILCRRLNCDFS